MECWVWRLPVRQWTRVSDNQCDQGVSKLPVRQWTISGPANVTSTLSKLPVRQWTSALRPAQTSALSKLPVRQWTLCCHCQRCISLSKLPVRQWTRSLSPRAYSNFSKLPVRQWTVTRWVWIHLCFSKLPVRQWTGIIADYPIDLLLKLTKSQIQTLFPDFKIAIKKNQWVTLQPRKRVGLVFLQSHIFCIAFDKQLTRTHTVIISVPRTACSLRNQTNQSI